MSEDARVSRRDFFRMGAAAAAVGAALPAMASDEDKPGGDDTKPLVLPRRKLGRTGVEVTILSQGAAFPIDTRHLNMMHSLGIRHIVRITSW